MTSRSSPDTARPPAPKREAEDFLAAYARGELAPELHARFAAHLATCATCARHLAKRLF